MIRPWMPLYVADYRQDTAHLSAAQHGAYLLLIMHYWATGSLPDDDGQLARIACLSVPEWKRNRAAIAAFFENGWKHKRIEAEIAKAEAISEAGRRAGKASAERRRQRSLHDPTNGRSTVVEKPYQRNGNQSQPQSQKDGGGDARARPPEKPSSGVPRALIRPEATEIATEIAALCGHPTPRDWPPGFCGAAYTVETWLAGGWTRPAIIAGVQESLARKRDGPPETIAYFAKPIARVIARNSAPLPKFEANEVREDRSYGSTQSAKSGLAAIGRIFDRVAEGNAGASGNLHEAPVLSLPPRSVPRS